MPPFFVSGGAGGGGASSGVTRVAPDGNDLIVWALDDAAGTTNPVNTGSTGGASNLSLAAGVTMGRNGLFGACASVDSGGTANLNGAAAVQPGTFTASLWFRTMSYPCAILTRVHGVSEGPNNFSVGIEFASNYTPVISVRTAFTGLLSVGSTTVAKSWWGQWNHVGCTYDGSTLIGYLNGDSIGSIGGGGAMDYDPSFPWTIGGVGVLGSTPSGRFDDVRIASVARPASWFASVFKAAFQLS